VTYNGNTNGSGAVPTDGTAYSSGASVTVANNTGALAKTGYTFGGWCTTQPAAGAACGGTSRAAGSSFAISANVTLYAVWTANTLTVTTDEQSGSAIADASTTTGASMNSPGTPTREGFVFAGWFTASTGGSAIGFPYAHGQTASFTLYAQWTALSARTISIDGGSYSATYNRYAAAPTLTSTASAGAGVKTYTSSTTTVCTVGGATGVVSFVTAGTCSIVVAIAADVTYASATSSAISISVTYAIGDTGPGGGKIFILPSTAGNSSGNYFEAALNTWNAGSDGNNRWCNITNGAVGASAQGIDIGTGQANTNAIVAYCSSGAAVDARAYTGGSLSDWFLPSENELKQLWVQSAVVGLPVTKSQCCPNPGIVNTSSYWSSTEIAASRGSPATQAYPASSSTGSDNWGKQYGFNVRPVRMFAPIS